VINPHISFLPEFFISAEVLFGRFSKPHPCPAAAKDEALILLSSIYIVNLLDKL